MPVRDRGRWMEKTTAAYRFGPPKAPLGDDSANGVQNSEEFARAHGQGGGEGLLRGHPKITVYEIALEREAERYYGPD